MAFIEVDEPAMLDSTGQDIVDKLDAVKTAVTGLGTTLATDKANRDASNITDGSAWRSAIGLGAESIYGVSTYQNDIGTARSIGSFNFQNYSNLRIYVYINSLSSSTRGVVNITNCGEAIGASYFPCCINGTMGNVRIESTNNSITLLSSSFGNSMCIGNITGIKL